MSKRISHSLLDPWLTTPLRRTYPWLRLPRSLPPEAIIAVGHAAAIAGAVGFALSTRAAWAGLLAAAGVALNHASDVLDGTHARATNQCRNGGELLDHFVDPLSFAYWVVGLSASAAVAAPSAPWLGMAGLIVLLAIAVLTNIRAKMTGEFILASFGPTEFKTLLVLFALQQAWRVGGSANSSLAAATVAWWFLAILVAAGVVQLVLSLRSAVREVNGSAAAVADTTEWQHGR